MIEEAFDAVSNVLSFLPQTVRGWGFYIFVLGLIWFGAFGVFVGYGKAISLMGLGVSLAGMLTVVVSVISGSRKSG